MKKIIALSAMALMLIVAMVSTSCSTAKSVSSAFEKNGYVMGELTPQQQAQLAPIVSAFPAFNQTAIAYLQTEKSITFVFPVDETAWNTYTLSLVNAGFSNMGIGFVKADKAQGVTYNVSAKPTTIYKQNFMLVTYTYATF